MTDDRLKTVLLEALASVAPEIDPGSVDPARDLRDQLDLDSMDFLNFMIAVHERLGIDIPEADYPQLSTLDAAIRYLERAQSAAGAR
ncbi:MAG TPA: acyl carrier protein [Alphaproteobacteria bacterium]